MRNDDVDDFTGVGNANGVYVDDDDDVHDVRA
jgi:hypothetical protein